MGDLELICVVIKEAEVVPAITLGKMGSQEEIKFYGNMSMSQKVAHEFCQTK